MGKIMINATATSDPTTTPTPASTPTSTPAFDLNVAVVTAGFSFDAYKTPDSNAGYSQKDVTGCDTLYVSKEFLDEWYSGQLTVEVVKAVSLPDVDFFGTSDPYVVVEVADGYGETKVIGGNTNPIWNETLTYLILPSKAILKVKVKDINPPSSDKKLGETTMPLKDFCDGKSHTIELDLKGENGGGRLTVEVKYQSFEEIGRVVGSAIPISDEAKAETLKLFQSIIGSPISVTDFVTSSAAGVPVPEATNPATTTVAENQTITEHNDSLVAAGWKPATHSSVPVTSSDLTASSSDLTANNSVSVSSADLTFNSSLSVASSNFTASRSVSVGSLDLAASSALATDLQTLTGTGTVASTMTGSVPESQTAESVSVFKETDALVASYAVVKATEILTNSAPISEEEKQLLGALFATAETTVEAWALLASSLNQPSVVKSKFEKICFVQNKASDTQASIWRDLTNKRLVVAFRGTEPTNLVDWITDIKATPAFDDNAWVHAGFAEAINSIKDRLTYGIKHVLESPSSQSGEGRWQVWFTGHSLGAALATLFAKEWAESPLGTSGKYDIKMYNFGSPRVGFEDFVEQYSALVKDSWRVVNLRDVVPSVPTINDYMHVPSQYIVEAISDSEGKTPEEEQKKDRELAEYLYGDTFVLHNLLETQLAIASIIKGGTGLAMHMQNFYYLALLQDVKAQLAIQSKAKIGATM